MRRDRFALALIVVGTVLLSGGVPVVWAGVAAVAVGTVFYAEARRRESLSTFSVLLGALSLIFLLTIWLSFLAVPTSAAGLVLAVFAPRGRPRTVGFVVNGLAFVPSAALVILIVVT